MNEASALVAAARQKGFYQLVLQLERMAGGAGSVGTDAAPHEEPVRFRHDPSLAFSAADVVDVREAQRSPRSTDAGRAAGRGWEVVTTFLGLSGAVGPLPLHLATEITLEDPDSPRLRDFLDLFHHRLISLLYRARASRDVPNSWRSDGRDAWTPRLLALLGVDAQEPSPQTSLPAWKLLRLAPLLAERVLTADALEAALTDLLAEELGGARVTVEPFAGAWVEISRDEQNALGERASGLGQDLVLGQCVFDAAGRFRVVVGPLEAESYARFVSGGALRGLAEVLDALVAEPLDREIVLSLAEGAALPLQLGGSHLGSDAWLGGQRSAAQMPVSWTAAGAVQIGPLAVKSTEARGREP